MKHVRLRLTADGREGEIHPMYDVLANADFVERATAIHWNFTGEELGIMHYVEGDADAYEAVAESTPEVLDFEIKRTGDDSFYVYIRDATNEPVRQMFGAITTGGLVVVPPIEYNEDGTVSISAYGPSGEIQAAIEAIPDPVTVTVDEIGGLGAVDDAIETLLSERQRAAVEAAIDEGYYEIPRECTHEDVARAIDCAPSTAAEHLRKAESKVLQAILA